MDFFEEYIEAFSGLVGVEPAVGLIILIATFCFMMLAIAGVSRQFALLEPPPSEEAEAKELLVEPLPTPEGELAELEQPSLEPQKVTQPQKRKEIVSEPGEPLDARLAKTKRGFFDKIRTVFASGAQLNDEMLEELRYALVSSDLGVHTVDTIMGELSSSLKRGEQVSEDDLVGRLKQQLVGILDDQSDRPLETLQGTREDPYIVMVVGVNGVGKTTTCAKLAHQLTLRGLKILLVAADTFRAAAVEQLKTWGSRLDVPVVSGAENAKPQSVVFDAMLWAKKERFDVVLIDTAGRLHTKTSLMQELEGIHNAIQRHFPTGPQDVLLVVDGSTGQNALNQAREFNAATTLTGLIITKLDGTPKGGIVVAIRNELGIPVRYIGVGESQEDLRPFQAAQFVDAILAKPDSEQMGAPEERVSAHGETRRRRRSDATRALP